MRELAGIFIALAAAAAQPLPLSTPAREGFSPERLERLHAAMNELVRSGQRSGAITMLVRNGRIADWQTYGYRDLEGKRPMERDTICAAFSMTKVITSVAVLMLMEEGRFELTDAAARYVPQLERMRVFSGGTAEHPEVVQPARPITIQHLLTHTSGMVYGSIYTGEPTPVHKLWERANLSAAANLKDFVERLSGLPLIAHPGEAFHYGMSTDVLGYLVETVSGIPFEKFLERRIFAPLKMSDSYFWLPEEKLPRAAKIYRSSKGGGLEAVPYEFPRFPSGGGGLRTTIGDYARFAQMLLNGGELDGVRLLSRKTVELMMADHLPRPAPMLGQDGMGFGLGGSVRLNSAQAGALGSAGDFGWAGAATTWFRIDPKEKMTALMFFQHLPIDFGLLRRFSTLVYQALE